MTGVVRVDAPATAGTIFDLVRRGVVRTRGEISRETGLAPSTVSQRVDALIDHGLIEETRSGAIATGGRQPRLLQLRPEAGAVASAALGARHVVLRIASQSGDEIVTLSEEIDVSTGAEATIDAIWSALRREMKKAGIAPSTLRGIAIGLPAPVDSSTGTVSSSAQLPGWDHLDLHEVIRRHTAVPVVLANDANLLATAEHRLADPAVRHMLAVKIGSRIGSGLIVDRRVYTGASGAAGEISHSPSSGTSAIRCFCGTQNCLESVASGSAMLARLQADGHEVTTTGELVALAGTGEPAVLELLRESGRLVGAVLAEFVNFLNPDLITFGGALAAADAFVAAIRGTIFQRSLPVVTADLDVRLGRAGVNAEADGGVHLVLDTILTAESIDRMLAEARVDRPHPAAV